MKEKFGTIFLTPHLTNLVIFDVMFRRRKNMLNFDRFDNQGAEKPQWEKIIANGFIDAYADFIIANSDGQETLETLCEDEDNADEHCTVGVSELDGPNARRIDYIFTKTPSTIRDARVVFNTLVNSDQPTVSDHAGVFISLDLP